MRRPLAYRGERLDIVFAVRRIDSESGLLDSPGLAYFKTLSDDLKRKFGTCFKLLASKGHLFNRQKFKPLDDGFCEFKVKQHRLMCRFTPGQLVIITHGFAKKKDDIDPEEFDRAREIFRADQSLEARGLLFSDRGTK